MKKIIIQGVTIIALFISIWFTLTQINWLTIFKVQKITDNTEQKIGELFWEIFQKTEKENTNPFVVASVDSIVTKICSSNNIDRELIKIHILDKDDINAFACNEKAIKGSWSFSFNFNDNWQW